jgi:tyrosine-protein kinase Etk/Wzc
MGNNEEKSIDIFFLLSIIFRYKWFIIISTGVSAAAVLLFTAVTAILPPEINPLPDVYRSTAVLLLHEKMTGDILAPFTWWEQNVLAGKLPTNFSYGELAMKLLRGNTLIDTLAEEFKLGAYYKVNEKNGEQIRFQIRKRLSLNYEETTMTLTVMYEDYNPEMSFKITNGLVDLLRDVFFSINRKRSLFKKDLLETKLAEVNDKITEVEGKVKDFQRQHGVLDVENIATEKSTMMANLRSQLYLKEMELKTYSQFSKIEDPAMMKLQAERNNLLRLIKEMENGYSGYEDVLPSQQDLPKMALEYSHLKRDLLVQEKIYEALSQEYELVKLSIEGEEMLFQVIENPEVPQVKVGPHRMWICALTVVVAFIASVVLAFVFFWVGRHKEALIYAVNGGDKSKKGSRGLFPWSKK